MRSLSFAAVLLAVLPAFGTSDSPFFQLAQASKDAKVHVTGKNISRSPIVAYVVLAEHGHWRVVWKGVYSVGDTLGPGKTVDLGDVPTDSTSEHTKLLVDYVRLADGTAWGNATTEEAKEIAARYQK